MSSIRLKHVVRINPEKLGDDTPRDFQFRYVDIGSVGRGRLVDEPVPMDFESAPSRARRVLRPGDTVVSTVRTYLRAVLPIEESGLVGSTGFACLRPTDEVDARFLGWWAQSDEFIEEVVARSVGVSYPAINPSEIGLMQFPLRPLAAQRAIADFLDTETGGIDALIAKKQRLRDLLRQRAQTAFDAATASVDDRIPLKRLVDFREGPGVMAEDFRDEGVPLLRIAGLHNGRMTARGCNFLEPDMVRQRWAHLRVRSGDLVISASASMGMAGFVGDDADGAVPYTGLIRFRPATEDVDLTFVRYFLESYDFTTQVDLMKTGATIQHFGPTHLAQVTLPLVFLPEQRRIVCELEELHGHVGRLASKLETQLALLREHRQALITAAVTGELEVPGVAA